MSAAGDLSIGIDIGTTSVKGVLVNADGEVVARKRIPHAMIAHSPRHMEHDPRIAWRRSPRRVLAALARPEVRAIGVTGMGPSMTAVGRGGVPRGPGLLYGDIRGNAQGGMGEAVGFLRALSSEHPSATGFWPAQTTALVSIGGEPVIGNPVAAMMHPLWTGTGWNSEVLESFGVRTSQLPVVRTEKETAGTVGGAVLDCGSLDVGCERMLAGQIDDDEALVLLGSTLILMVSVPEGTSAHGVWIYPTGIGTIATGASNGGAFFIDWVDRVIAPAMGPLRPDRVPVWEPYIRGERTPWHDPDRRAALVDLDVTHDASAVRRAAYEATGFVVRHHLDLVGAKPRRVVAVGGGTAVPAWTQALADVVGVPVEIRGSGVGAATGAAFMGRLAAGLEASIADVDRWVTPGATVDPDRDWLDPVSARYRRFLELVGPVGESA